jgi:hypothetical protein
MTMVLVLVVTSMMVAVAVVMTSTTQSFIDESQPFQRIRDIFSADGDGPDVEPVVYGALVRCRRHASSPPHRTPAKSSCNDKVKQNVPQIRILLEPSPQVLRAKCEIQRSALGSHTGGSGSRALSCHALQVRSMALGILLDQVMSTSTTTVWQHTHRARWPNCSLAAYVFASVRGYFRTPVMTRMRHDSRTLPPNRWLVLHRACSRTPRTTTPRSATCSSPSTAPLVYQTPWLP